MSKQEWQGVPLEHQLAWQAIFNAAPPSEGERLSSSCPICGVKALYRYYTLGKARPQELAGLMYKGPGSYWEWCSACHSFEHMSVYVPEWWNILPLKIDHSRLTAIPDLIDEAMPADDMR